MVFFTTHHYRIADVLQAIIPRPIITGAAEPAVRFDSFVELFADFVASAFGCLWIDHRSISLLPCEKFLAAG